MFYKIRTTPQVFYKITTPQAFYKIRITPQMFYKMRTTPQMFYKMRTTPQMFYTIWNRLYSCLFVPGKLEREKIRYWKSRNTVPVEEDARLYTVKMHDRGRHTYHSIAALTTERIQHYLRIECKATGQWGHHHPIHSEVYKSAKVGVPLKSSTNR